MRETLALPGLPDILAPGLRVVFVGYNPSLAAARAGHYYANLRNAFYTLLYRHGLTPALLTPDQDRTLPSYGLGLTDLCPIPSRSAADIPRRLFLQGRDELRRKLLHYAPRLVCFNGKGVYERFFGKVLPHWGVQEERIGESAVFVVPSTSLANNGLAKEREAAFRELARLLAELASVESQLAFYGLERAPLKVKYCFAILSMPQRFRDG